jgi:hypothetical protein
VDEVHLMGSYSQKKLSTIMVESFPIKMVKNGYCCGVNMWLSLLTVISFSTCTFQLLWSAGEKKNITIEKIHCNQKCHFKL